MNPDRERERDNGRRDGEHRKRRTLTLLEARRELFVLHGRRALLRCLLDAGSATMDDVRDVVALPADIDPTLFGSVPGMLAFAGIIRAVGFAKTSRPKAHARPLTVWQLVDRGKAERWLTDHPDPADTSPIVATPVTPSVIPIVPPAPSPIVTSATECDRPAVQQNLFADSGEG